MVFLHAFITSGRPGGRAGEGQAGKVISGRVFGLFLDGRSGCQSYFWTRRSAKLFLGTSPGGRAGGRADKLFSKIISGHVSGRAGGRTGWQSYFWTRLAISGHVVVFLHAFITSGRSGGRTEAAKAISGHVFSKIISGHVSGRAGGRADKLFKVISGHVFSKIISGHVSGRAGGRTGWQSYFWTRLAISGRVVVFLHAFITSGRPGGRAGEGRTAKLFLDTSLGGRAGGQAAKVISGSRLPQNYFWARLRAGGRAGEERLPKLLRFAWQAQDFGSFLFEKLRRPRTKCSFWKLCCLKS